MPKKANDVNKPRGPATAYSLFVRTCREELRRKYPQLTVDYSVISRKCSERWKAMTEHEKKRFNDTAELQRKRHREEMATYLQEQSNKQQPVTSSILLQTPTTPFIIENSQTSQAQTLLIPNPMVTHPATIQKKPVKKRERKPKDPLAPKKPLSAYFLFCADERPKLQSTQSGMSVSEIAKELGQRWKNAPIELRNKYEQSASEKKDVYKNEMALYKNQTSISSSPPETPQTPLTPSDYPNNYSSMSIQQQHQQQQQQQIQQKQLLALAAQNNLTDLQINASFNNRNSNTVK